jgi:hypothetical protein
MPIYKKRKTRRTKRRRQSYSRKRKIYRGGHIYEDMVLAEPSQTEKINEVNVNNIYRFKLDDDCHIYTLTQKSYDYVGIFNKKLEKYVIFKINEDIPYPNNVTEIDKNNIRFIGNKKRLPKCHNTINLHNLTNAKEKIKEINQMLNKKCDNLHIDIDYLYNLKLPNNNINTFDVMYSPYTLYLCLNNDVGCVSSITCDVDKHSVSIDSKTKRDFEGKKYNKLLRCILIIIAKEIYSNINSINSLAINAISAHLLIYYFNGTTPLCPDNSAFYDFIEKNGINVNDVLYHMDKIKQFYSQSNRHQMYITIDLTPENIANAERLLPQIIDEVVCN